MLLREGIFRVSLNLSYSHVFKCQWEATEVKTRVTSTVIFQHR